MDALFTPDGAVWAGVSPQLRRMRRTVLTACVMPAAVVAALLLGLLVHPGLATAPLLVGLAVLVWGWRVIGRNWASWRYCEREDDLVVSRGVLFRATVVVPYGRMQFVDVTTGPLEQAFGIATVQLHTAAATTDARVPGLPPAEAARLRDRLTERGRARSAGL